MGKFDGDPQSTMTRGQALVEIANAIGWGSEEKRDEIVKALQEAHPDETIPYGKPAPTGVTDPTVQALSDTQVALAKAEQEKAELRAQLAEAEANALRAQLAAARAGATPDTYNTPTAPADAPATEVKDAAPDAAHGSDA